MNGLKTLTINNWLQPDPASAHFVRRSYSDGTVSRLSAEDWLSFFLDPTLSESVPENVHSLFEVARGSLVYGYFFYPLYTLACEQLFRVAETAVTEKCKMLGAPKRVKKFHDKVQFLKETQVISAEQYSDLDELRRFRNSTSHPELQAILSPGAVTTLLFGITDTINELFA